MRVFPERVPLPWTGRVGAYVTDEDGETIRYIYSPAGIVSTVAGLANQSPINNYNDGVGSDARFISPYGITVDTAGNVFITDISGATVLKGVPPSLSPIGSFSESPGVSPCVSTILGNSRPIIPLWFRICGSACNPPPRRTTKEVGRTCREILT